MNPAIYAQFGKPTGALGRVAGWIMAQRPSNRERNRWTVELLDLAPSDQVLELGFGPGLSVNFVAQQLVSGTLVGIDHSAVMLEQALRRNRRWVEAGRVRLLQGDTELLPTLGTFDKVLSVNVLQFASDRRNVLQKLRGALSVAGVLATTYQPRHSGALAADADRFAESLALDMQTCGFRSIRIERLPLRPMPAVCVLGARD